MKYIFSQEQLGRIMESHPEWWSHNLSIKRRISLIWNLVKSTYSYKFPCDKNKEGFVQEIISEVTDNWGDYEDDFKGVFKLDVQDFIDDFFRDELYEFWETKCLSNLHENYKPSVLVRRRLPEIRKVLLMAMQSHDDKREFNDFVENVLDYIFSYFMEHSTLTKNDVEKIVEYVGETSWHTMNTFFLNHSNEHS